MSNPDIVSRFDEIYDSTHKPVLAVITAKCMNVADIADIFQDTYMELYQILFTRGANYITNPKAFVLKLAKRKLARYYSLMTRLRMFVSPVTENDDGEPLDLTEFKTNNFLTEDLVVNQAMLTAARQFLKTRPQTVQKVFYLFYDVDLTVPEIAQTLGLTESSVKNKLYRTLKELRKTLKEWSE